MSSRAKQEAKLSESVSLQVRLRPRAHALRKSEVLPGRSDEHSFLVVLCAYCVFERLDA